MAVDREFLLAGEGAIFVQPDGPNTKPLYMGCHMLGDVTIPKGDVTLYRCPDPSGPNKWVVKGSSQGEAGVVTTQLSTDVNKVKDALETLKCPAAMWVHKITCGRMNVFSGYDRSFFFPNIYVTQRGLTALAAKDQADQNRSAQTFDIAAEDEVDLFEMDTIRISTTVTDKLTDITSCDSDRCAGNCGDAADHCDTMYVSAGLYAGSPTDKSQIQKTTNGWATQSALAAFPFAVGEEIASIRCFQTDRDTTRILVARGTTDAGNPAEVAYSDDDGVTWTNANVGSTNGQYMGGAKSLFVYDQYNIWAVTTGGYIYKSEDGGATWTAQHSGTLSVQNINGIHFSDGENGIAFAQNNVLYHTSDGGITWELLTAPAAKAGVGIRAGWIHNSYRFWIGYTDGALYYTHNGGTTWAARTITNAPTSIFGFSWYDIYIGAMIGNIAGIGYIYLTIDGGYTWERLPLITNAGFLSVYICNPTLIYAVGGTYGGTGFIEKASGG